MEVYLFNGNGKTEITNIVTSLTLSGEYRSPCRSLSFGIIKSQTDLNTYTVPLNLGNQIKVLHENKVLFHGLIWTRAKSTDGHEINYTCKDYGVYLLKNKGSYKFNHIAPGDAVRKLCGDFNINIGTIAGGESSLSRKFLGVRLYDIIKSCYTLTSKKGYFVVFEGDKLNVFVKGAEKAGALESGINLLTCNVSETLENMVNEVKVYGKDDTLIKTFKNDNEIKLYGLMSEYMKVYDTKTDYNTKAQKTLTGIESKISVTNFGHIGYTTGKAVEVIEPYNGLKGTFYIDADEHSFKNGIYTNKLTLNFQNISDTGESGSEVE